MNTRRTRFDGRTPVFRDSTLGDVRHVENVCQAIGSYKML
jgi:hypothetical protein